jgi:hypothetical protein
MYAPHPNAALTAAFRARPFQGGDPTHAHIVFVGLDANYDSEIEHASIFPAVLNYLEDGVRFCREHGVHHPFLLPGYRGDGRKYHQTFARLGLSSENVATVSFIELLHLPTVGRSRLTPADLDPDHLRWVNGILTAGRARAVFLPTSVASLMRRSHAFPWLPRVPAEDMGALKIWCRGGQTTLYWHYHLSVYGKFEQKKAQQLSQIRTLLLGRA